MKRRHFIRGVVVTSAASLLAEASGLKIGTPSEIQGPFYPISPQKDTDADLTQVSGREGFAKGKHIQVFGQVFDRQSQPIRGVKIEIWQANSTGKYHHPHDNSVGEIDENFQSWAIFTSDEQGRYQFKTVMPGAYPLPDGQTVRTPHIHFKIGKTGYTPLLTQMYFPDQSLNASDPLIKRKTTQETRLMTAQQVSNMSNSLAEYKWNIVLEKS